ncbi:MAG: hypothetical protein C0607_03565 [Azoarcus sp.]|nr:MAG: hypothetical protein C0607_03565 [Azoarcus sp.]
MPQFQDFMNELVAAGVRITGAPLVQERALAADDWGLELVQLALAGRKIGVAFSRLGLDAPSDAQLDAILAGYSFSSSDRRLFIQNVTIAGDAPYSTTAAPTVVVLDGEHRPEYYLDDDKRPSAE